MIHLISGKLAKCLGWQYTGNSSKNQKPRSKSDKSRWTSGEAIYITTHYFHSIQLKYIEAKRQLSFRWLSMIQNHGTYLAMLLVNWNKDEYLKFICILEINRINTKYASPKIP